MSTKFTDLQAAVAAIPDGASIAFAKLYPMALVRELVRQNKRGLRFVGMPIAGFAADFLAASGVIASVESGAVTLGAIGPAANYQRAVRAGTVAAIPSSCSVVVAALTAGTMGQPFAPVPGVLGSGVLERRKDFAVVPNPFAPETDIVLVPALQPDFALIHALSADPDGNLVVGGQGDEALLARAAKHTIATVETVAADALDTRPRDSEIIASTYVDAVVAASRGTYPFPGYRNREQDDKAISAYVAASVSQETATTYIDHVVRATRDEAGYIAKAGA